MPSHKFLNIITKDETFTVIRNSKKLYRFETAKSELIRNDDLFWWAAINTFPLNPPKKTPGHLSEALKDSLLGGLLGRDDDFIDAIWEYADNVPKKFLIEKVNFFHELAFSIEPSTEREARGETGVTLRLFLVCSNKQSKNNLEKEFLSLEKLGFEID